MRVTTIATCLAISVVTSLIISYFAFSALSKAKSDSITAEFRSSLDTLRPHVIESFRQVERDILMLQQLPPIAGIERALRNGGYDELDSSTLEQWHSRLAMIFKPMLQNRPAYLQIRLISASDDGQELVRVERTEQGDVVLADVLQKKGAESYHRPTIALKPGQLYYSNIDLNREFGEVGPKRQVVIRITTPVGQDDLAPYGFIIINVDYPKLMAGLIKEMGWGYHHYLIDQNGNYLSYDARADTTDFVYALYTPEHIRIADYFNSLDLTRRVHEVADGNGGKNILVTQRVDLHPEGGWLHLLLVSSAPKSAVVGELAQYRNLLIIWGAVLMLITLALAYALAELNIRPVLRTLKRLADYASGKRTTLELPKTRVKELQALSFGIQGAVDHVRIAAEKERAALAKYEVMFNSVADGVITANDDGIIQAVNPALRAMFGYRPMDLIGKNITELMPEHLVPAHEKGMAQLARSSGNRFLLKSAELQGKRKDGSVFPIEISVTAQTFTEGTVFTGIIKDISVRKQREAELQTTMRELKQSNEELDEFAYVVSHDLREPMRGMQMHAQKLLRLSGELDEDSTRRLSRLNLLAEKMQGQIGDLLYFSRLGRAELDTELVNSQRLLDEVIDGLENFLEENNATVTVPSPLPVVTADKQRLNSIFSNLITNAIKYNSQEQKSVQVTFHSTLKTRFGMAHDVFAVADNGIGIEAQFHKDIFRIFKRLNAESEFGGGTGAGLTFVKKSVERHGGSIWLDSELGQGTTFYFSLRKQNLNPNPAVVSHISVA